MKMKRIFLLLMLSACGSAHMDGVEGIQGNGTATGNGKLLQTFSFEPNGDEIEITGFHAAIASIEIVERIQTNHSIQLLRTGVSCRPLHKGSLTIERDGGLEIQALCDAGFDSSGRELAIFFEDDQDFVSQFEAEEVIASSAVTFAPRLIVKGESQDRGHLLSLPWAELGKKNRSHKLVAYLNGVAVDSFMNK